jgi:hypothetical protein
MVKRTCHGHRAGAIDSEATLSPVHRSACATSHPNTNSCPRSACTSMPSVTMFRRVSCDSKGAAPPTPALAGSLSEWVLLMALALVLWCVYEAVRPRARSAISPLHP